jgi:hypothetical protein
VIRDNDKKFFSNNERFEKRLKPLSHTLYKMLSRKSVEYCSTARVLQPHIEVVITFLESFKDKQPALILLSHLCSIVGNILSTAMGDAKNDLAPIL